MTELTVKELIKQGETCLSNKNYRNAATFFRKASKLEADNPEIFCKWGYSLYFSNNNKIEEALALIGKSINIDPNNFTAYETRIKIYEKIKKLDHAINDYTTLLSIDSQNLHFYYKRAQLKERKGSIREAIKDMDYILDNIQESIEFYIYRGLLKIKIKRFQDAIVDFKKVLRIEPDHEEALKKMNYCEKELKKDHEIIAIVNKFRKVMKYRFIHFWDNLDEFKTNKIRSSYKITDEDEPLFFINTTLLSYAKGGLLMTDKKLILKKGNNLKSFYFNDIKSMSCEKHFSGVNKFKINNELVLDILFGDLGSERFLELFTAIKKYSEFKNNKSSKRDNDSKIDIGQSSQATTLEENDIPISNNEFQYEPKKEPESNKIGAVLIGLVLIALGIILTVKSYDNASGGGTYVIWYGLILVGVISFIKGLM